MSKSRPEETHDADLNAYNTDNLNTNGGSNGNIEPHYTREDADSLVGGQDIPISGTPTPDNNATSNNITNNIYSNGSSSPAHEFFGQKVFLFSLPFGGGLSSLKYGFKLPFLTHKDEARDPELEQLRLRLERQQLLATVEEARVFSSQKGIDDVRFRAMKHSLKENISDFLPEFILKSKKSYEAVYAEISGPIVVLGGYRGSILRETATGKRAWVPLKAGLNLRRINLLLGPLPDAETSATDLIYPDGILKNIGPFDLCKRFLKKIDNGTTSVTEFGYDWRLSLAITADQLVALLETLRRKTGRKPIVVAHSMGGLVAHGAMQKRPDLFRGLVYVGVPSECLNILGPLRYGDLVMFSDKILTYETNFMMRSLFALLPLLGRVFSNKDTGEQYDMDFFDPETWVQYNLNPLVSSARRALENEHSVDDFSLAPVSPSGLISSRIRLIQYGINRRAKTGNLTNLQMQKLHKSGRLSPASSLEEVSEEKYSFSFTEAYDYLCDTLTKTKAFLVGLKYDPNLEEKYPPLAVVYGDKVPSVRGSYVQSRQDIKDGNYYHFYYGRGDGVVHLKWLMPEKRGFQMYDPKTKKGHIVGKFASSAGHVNLTSDLEAMAGALGAILDAEKSWKS